MTEQIGMTDSESKRLQKVRKRFAKMEKLRIARLTSHKIYGERVHSIAEGEPLTTLFYRGEGGLIVTVHGGGFASNCVYDEDAYCQYLQERTGKNVISLDYTLTHRARYPVQLNQCVAQIESFIKRLSLPDRQGVVLIGHSAGANLAAAITLKAAQQNIFSVAANVLDYPALDNFIDPKRRKRYPFTLSDRLMRDFCDLYVDRGEARKDAFVSPLYMSQSQAAKMPPTLIIKASGDKLAQDADVYLALLRSVGRRAEIIEARAPHGFIEVKMKKVFAHRAGASVRYAKKITDESLLWLQEVLKHNAD